MSETGLIVIFPVIAAESNEIGYSGRMNNKLQRKLQSDQLMWFTGGVQPFHFPSHG